MPSAKPLWISKHWLISSGALALQTVKEVSPSPELAAVLGPMSVVAGAVLSYGLNRITSAHDKQDELQAATRDLLTNHDVALAQAHAISARLGRYADQLPPGNIATRLRELARQADSWWLTLVNDPAREDLAALRDDQVVDLLTAQLTTEDPFEIPLATWQEIIIEADATVPGGPKLGPEVAAYFAKHHHASFRADFIEALKTDLQTSGKAIAAVLLRYLAALLSELRAIAATQDEMKSDLNGISKTLIQLQKAVTAQRAQPGLTDQTRAYLEGIEHRISLDLDAILHRIDQLLLNDESHRAELQRLRTLLEEALATIKERDITLLAAIRELPAALAAAQQAHPQADKATQLASAYTTLDETYHLPSGTLERELPAFARKLLASPDTPLMDQANAEYTLKNFAGAEEIALQAKDAALAAAEQAIQSAISALMLAGQSASGQIQYKRALSHYRAAAALTSKERDVLAWAAIQNEIGWLLHRSGQYDEQAKLMRHVWRISKKAGHPDHPITLRAHVLWSNALFSQGSYAAAEKQYRAVLAIRENTLGLEHPDTLSSRGNLTIALSAQGKHAEADEEHRTVLAIRERVLGPEHPQTLKSRHNMANALYAQGKHAEAEAAYRVLFAVRKRVLGAKHPDTLMSRNNLAATLYSQDKFFLAEAEHRAVLVNREDVLRSEHPDIFQSCYNLSEVLEQLGRRTEAMYYARRALVGWSQALGKDHRNSQDAKRRVEHLEAGQPPGRSES
jgi:hypothetical protein